MQRPAAVVGNVVGDIDQRVDRPKPDRLEAPLQPLRARAVLHASDHAPGKHRTGARGLLVEIELDGNWIGEAAFDRLHRIRLQLAEAGSGKVAGDAAHAEAVWPVWRDGDLDHRVVETESLRRGAADLGVGGKLDDAGMLVGKLKLSLRQKHAVRLNAPDLGLGEREIDARHIASDRREHALEALARVRRAAHDLQALGAGIDLAD